MECVQKKGGWGWDGLLNLLNIKKNNKTKKKGMGLPVK